MTDPGILVKIKIYSQDLWLPTAEMCYNLYALRNVKMKVVTIVFSIAGNDKLQKAGLVHMIPCNNMKISDICPFSIGQLHYFLPVLQYFTA